MATGPGEMQWMTAGSGIVHGDGEVARIVASEQGVRFFLVSGEPVREPIAWRGPAVMSTEAELRQAFEELRAGTFLKG